VSFHGVAPVANFSTELAPLNVFQAVGHMKLQFLFWNFFGAAPTEYVNNSIIIDL